MRYVYTGPSWAASSYPLGHSSTNLAKEWSIPFANYARPASNALQCVRHLPSSNLPVVWVYNEPLGCVYEATGLNLSDVLTRPDWKDIWEACNQFCLQKIANLNRPVLLIGAHSDIVNCEHQNIVIAHDSWQKFLAQQAGMTVDQGTVYVKMDDGGDFTVSQGWGAEVLHRCMHENPNITPCTEVTDAIWDIFFFWKNLEKADLFHDVHPSLKGNQLFAEFLKPTIIKFLEDIQ
jgi:hypothetical protein